MRLLLASARQAGAEGGRVLGLAALGAALIPAALLLDRLPSLYPRLDFCWTSPHYFLIKVGILMLIYVWVRWTLPRLRYDLLMRLGWKVFLPLALLQIVIVAILIPLGWI